ncbi:uncharacterized protein LOC132741201 [Ruditapes philippinarum]|uniref:uncharacterized protein LOC132741201 n=1 Tax=Ruditapes philippinarum TaxID=129788 RepID=UPI00295BC79E|nr:uncharacterized protein LOC132741201 [Ruditapes philippinarum]XP_060585301.1 uncharacterized protein LOC132741201 [Ruditapes philippinarum]XP_060585302.1 uncharacterized protein LOC132741201 [Ruditapes philippinarum]XP_060585303.1 uncharacterized protein LOC132741201 [Ruditapes philippinarum]
MAQQISEYSHVVNTWECYPRVQYFQKRFRDVCKRFKNLTNKSPYPDLFRSLKLENELGELCANLETALQILVIGQDDLNKNDIIVTDEPFRRQSINSQLSERGHAAMTVAVCYTKDDGTQRLQDVVDTLGHFMASSNRAKLDLVENLFLVCKTNAPKSDEEVRLFCNEMIFEIRKLYGIEVSSDRIILGPNVGLLGSKISLLIESKLVTKFMKIEDHLSQVATERSGPNLKYIDTLENEQFVCAVRGFLRNVWGIIDDRDMHKDDDFIEIVLDSLVKVIRCSIVAIVSLKYSLPQDACHLLAHELNLEQKLKSSISRNTRYHLKKIEEFCSKAEIKHKQYIFPIRKFLFIAHPLKDDIKEQTALFEKELVSVQHGVTIMKKMLFEIRGYIKQSIVREGDISRKHTETTPIPAELRKKLLTLDGVFGVGTVYGEFEIHLKKTTETRLNDVKNGITEVFRNMNIHRPYRLREVLKEPVDLVMWQCETGNTLESISPDTGNFRKGTLGGFASNDDNQLFGLTCAHVVQGSAGEHDVYIKDDSFQQHMFGKSSPEMTVRFGSTKLSWIDFAAISVCDDVRQRCMQLLKDDDGILRTSKLSTACPSDLVGKYVYKYGAMTGFTEGIVCSSDYSMFDGQDSKSYIVLIDTKSCDGEFYAKEGDSGSINCISTFEGDDKIIEAVTMTSAGRFNVEGLDSSLCLSFLLSTAFQVFKQHSNGVELSMPTGIN